MTSLWRHVTRHVTPNYAKVSIKVWIFFDQSFIDVALGVLEILRGAQSAPHGYTGQKSPWWIGLREGTSQKKIYL